MELDLGAFLPPRHPQGHPLRNNNMASTGVDISSNPPSGDEEKGSRTSKAKGGPAIGDVTVVGPGDHTERRLKSRHIQLIGIGGTIGTALYVNIGRGLMHGGPASLFLAFSIW